MGEISQTDVAENVFDAVEALVNTSCIGMTCEYEYLPTSKADLPCIMVQTLTGKPIEREYLDGSYLANYRFALYLRTIDDSTRTRLDGRKILKDLASILCTNHPKLDNDKVVWSCECDTLPCRISTEPSYSDWQVTLTLKYKSHH